MFLELDPVDAFFLKDKYKPESQIEVVACEDKPKTVGKLNVKEFKLESTVEVKKGVQNDVGEIKPSVGKINKGAWNPVSQVGGYAFSRAFVEKFHSKICIAFCCHV